MGKQIMVSDLVYDELNHLRFYRGKRFSFNTVLTQLLAMHLADASGSDMYQKLQWYAIRDMLKKLELDGLVEGPTMQYSHVLRMLFNREYTEATEYIRGQFNLNIPKPTPPRKTKK